MGGENCYAFAEGLIRLLSFTGTVSLSKPDQGIRCSWKKQTRYSIGLILGLGLGFGLNEP